MSDRKGWNGVKGLNVRLRPLFVASVLAVAAVGCGKQSPQALMDSAIAFAAKGDHKEAVIQLRNVLQQQPENAMARYLLGEALSEQTDYVTAEKEFRRALEYGYTRDAVYAALARTMLAEGRNKDVVAEFRARTLADPEAAAALKSSLGLAHLRLGQREEAGAAFAAALKAKPGYPGARVGQAALIASDQDIAGAMKIVDEVLVAEPKFPEALNLKADLLVAQGDSAGAMKVGEYSTQIQPNRFDPRYALVMLRVRENDLAGAAADIASLRKAFPADPRIAYLDALLAFRQGDAARTRDAAQQLLKAIPDHGPGLYLAGAAEYQLRSFDAAAEYVRRVVVQYPQSSEAQLLLISAYLEGGHPERAQGAADAALRRAPNDPKLLALAGATAVASNDLAKASRYYERATALDQKDALTRTRLGQIRIASGDVDRAMKDLESASVLDATGYQADLALIAAHLRRKEYDKALDAASALAKKQPDSPVSYSVRGIIYGEMRDYAKARAGFAKALELQSDYLPAARGLARLDIMEKNPAAARGRFEAIIAKQPRNAEAFVELASVLVATGAPPKDVRATLERGVAASPDSVTAKLALAGYLLRAGDAQGALTLLQSAAATNPDDPRVLESLALAQQMTGELNQAIATYNKLVTLQPREVEPLIRLAAMHYAAKDYEASIQALRRAQALKPNSPEVLTEIVNVEVALGRTEAALADARAVQRTLPKEGLGFVLAGSVYAAQKNWDEAASSYREAVKRQPTALAVTRLHAVLRVQGKTAEAQALAAKWVKDHPEDPAVRAYLGEMALVDKNFREAARLYKEVLVLQPDNVVVLNNLALTALETKDPAALTYAEKAYGLAPNNASVVDTYGWVLLRTGDARRAVELLDRAVKMMPRSPELRLHLAKALIEANDKAAARREVDALLKLDASVAQRAEAEALLKGL